MRHSEDAAFGGGVRMARGATPSTGAISEKEKNRRLATEAGAGKLARLYACFTIFPRHPNRFFTQAAFIR